MNQFERATQYLQQNNIDGWLIVSKEDSDLHSPFMLNVQAHAMHYILVEKTGHHTVLATPMELPMIEASLNKMGVVANTLSCESMEDFADPLKKLLNGKKIALNYGEDIFLSGGTGFLDYIRGGDLLSLKNLSPTADFLSAAHLLIALRSVKTSDDIADLRECCKATIEILEDLPNWVKLGMTEQEVKAKLEYEYMKLGKVSFDSIIGNNANAADPHHNTSRKKIEPGVLLVDSGLKMNRMCSDITWTYWIGGEPPEEFTAAYHALYDAKIVANKYFIEGVNNPTPAIKCRESLTESGYDTDKLYIHGLGHSLGFEPHDVGERISRYASNNAVLRENMVYSNEPGLYWKGKWGLRLEDDVIIGKEKPTLLTYNPKDPIII